MDLEELESVESTDWTTDDEIDSIRHMFNRKNIVALQHYRRVLPYRDFHGAGMYVNVTIVRLTLNSLIDALEQELLG